MRVLIVRLSSMGDLVHALPALTDAAEANPTARFDWVVDQTFSDVPSWHKAVDRVIQCPPRRGGISFLQSLLCGKFVQFAKEIRQTKYDLIIDLQGDFKGAITSCLANGVRCGYDAQSVREWGAHFTYQQKFFVARGQHSIERMRQLMAQALSYPCPKSRPNYGIDRSRLPKVTVPFPFSLISKTPEEYICPAPISLPVHSLVFIHSTSWASKNYPVDCWQKLTGLALAAGFSVVLPWGSLKEQERAWAIADQRPGVYVLPDLSISQKASVIANARATVGCDTGLSHIAAALDIPSVAIYGATDPAVCGTIGENQKQIVSHFECVKCHHSKCAYTKPALFKPACLVEITPEKVWANLQGVMSADRA